MNQFFYPAAVLLLLTACGAPSAENTPEPAPVDTLKYPEEVHLANLRMMTNGGDNAEAYWSFDDKNLVFQARNEAWGVECDQIFSLDVNGQRLEDTPPTMLSTGNGRTTCSFYMPGNQSVLFASTHHQMKDCPPEPERTGGKYVWAIYPEFDIFTADLKGNILAQLTDVPGYDAEGVVSPKGDKIAFTSTRSGDLELYTMNLDGSNVVQVTNELGYDGGAFFSPDGTKLVFRSSRPKTPEEVKNYKDLLAQNLVEPSDMEIFTVNVDGTDMRQITSLGKANWAPYFHPSGEKIIFASNHHADRGFQFNLFMINIDGTGLKQITFDKVFDAFPMFSWDGKKLSFSSNRHNGGTRATNVFIADWVE